MWSNTAGRRAAHQAPEFRVSQNQATPEGQISLTSNLHRARLGYLPYSTVLCHTSRMFYAHKARQTSWESEYPTSTSSSSNSSRPRDGGRPVRPRDVHGGRARPQDVRDGRRDDHRILPGGRPVGTSSGRTRSRGRTHWSPERPLRARRSSRATIVYAQVSVRTSSGRTRRTRTSRG